MLVRFHSFSLDSTTQALLSGLNQEDTVVCGGDGVYAYKALKAAYPKVPIVALQNDCEERGVSVDNTLTSDEFFQLHQQHQQWINL